MWFTEILGNKVAKVTMTGKITEYTVPTPGSSPSQILSESASECPGVPNPLGLMTQRCHRVSGSIRECLREGVN
jgi:hypothetical protein